MSGGSPSAWNGTNIPHNNERAEALLGAGLAGSAPMGQIIDLGITPADLYGASHGLILQTMLDLYTEQEPIDCVTVATRLEQQGLLETAGGWPTITSLPMSTPAVSNVRRYGQDVLQDSAQRRILQTLQPILQAAQEGKIDTRKALEAVHQADQVLNNHTGQEILTNPPFNVLEVDELLRLSSPGYLLDGLIVKGALNILFGPSDSFKTFAAVDIALSIQSPSVANWFDRTCATGPVLYIAAEGADGMQKRVQAWIRHRQVEHPRILTITEAVNFYDAQAVDKLCAYIQALPDRPILVVIDTVARCSTGADENSTRDMGIIVSGFDRVRLLGLAVLAIHHTGHAGDHERGSSALIAAADARLKAEHQDGRLATLITVKKMKDDARAEPFTLHYKPLAGSLVADKVTMSREERRLARDQELDDQILTTVRADPGPGISELYKRIPGRDADIGQRVQMLLETGRLREEKDGNTKRLYAHEPDQP